MPTLATVLPGQFFHELELGIKSVSHSLSGRVPGQRQRQRLRQVQKQSQRPSLTGENLPSRNRYILARILGKRVFSQTCFKKSQIKFQQTPSLSSLWFLICCCHTSKHVKGPWSVKEALAFLGANAWLQNSVWVFQWLCATWVANFEAWCHADPNHGEK